MEIAKLKDKIRGCIIGGACGDALGYPVEFIYSFKAIRNDYGEEGIKEYDLRYPWLNYGCNKAQISDDTQMTLYTMQGLMDADYNPAQIVEEVTNNYLGWYCLQTGEYLPESYKSELTEIPELNRRRAPGNTCLSALKAIYNEEDVDNCSKGCGGVMRVAPVGIAAALQGWTASETAQLAADIAEITHLHIMSSYSSALLALLIRDCLLFNPHAPEEFAEIVEKSLAVLTDTYGDNAHGLDEFRFLIGKALEKKDDLRPDWEIIEDDLGEGWVAEETMIIAVFCVMRHMDDFAACLISAVNHGGDSDSTGAVAGNIIGSILGYESIPSAWIENLQLTDLMIRKSDEMTEIGKA